LGNVDMREEIRRLQAHLEAMEVGRQQDHEARDISELGEEVNEEGATPTEETLEFKLLRSFLDSSSGPKSELSTYDGSLVVENLFDWISELDNCFEYEEMDDEKRVKFVVTSLKGLATLWWDNV